MPGRSSQYGTRLPRLRGGFLSGCGARSGASVTLAIRRPPPRPFPRASMSCAASRPKVCAGAPVQDHLGAGRAGHRGRCSGSRPRTGQTALSTTYSVETPMKLESAILPVIRLRPAGILPASSTCVSDIFSGRNSHSGPCRRSSWAPNIAPAAGPACRRPPPGRCRRRPRLPSTAASMRFEVPRKLATNVVCGFS